MYIGDGCVEYEWMELEREDDVGKMFFIFSKFSSKDLVELNATFEQSLEEILVLLCKPMKTRFVDEIIVLMHDKPVQSCFYFIRTVYLFFLRKFCIIIDASLIVDVYFMNQLKRSLLLLCSCCLNSWWMQKK